MAPSSRGTWRGNRACGTPASNLPKCLRYAPRVQYLWDISVPWYELPGRIVLTVGLVTSWSCVVGLIILWLG
jgi:hypothetical protein